MKMINAAVAPKDGVYEVLTARRAFNLDTAAIKRMHRRHQRHQLQAELRSMYSVVEQQDNGMVFMNAPALAGCTEEPSHSVSYQVKVTRRAKFQRLLVETVSATVSTYHFSPV
jgi:hypothetical protein